MVDTEKFGETSPEGSPLSSLAPGTVVKDRYRIDEIIGRGGTSYVYKARDLHFPDVTRYVAVKELLNRTGDPSVREMAFRNFLREANVMVSLHYSAVPFLLDTVDVRHHAYLIMEYIEGYGLDKLIDKGKLKVKNIVQWAITLCDVLDYLHNHPDGTIIYRDMKPSHIVIEPRGRVRLIDFGIAKHWALGERGTMIGSEGYAAPEQFTGEVSPYSDQYGLGAVLHHALTHVDPCLEAPFSFAERPITALNPQVSPDLEAIIMKSLAFDAKARFKSMRDLKAGFERVYATFTQGPSNVLPQKQQKKAPARHVFISYSRKDTDIMHKVAADLEKNRLKIWTDENLEIGTSSWQKAIEQAIETAGGFVIILSPDAKDSQWVGNELGYAGDHEVKVFPVLARGDEKTSIPISLNKAQRLDIRRPDQYESEVRKLAFAITAHLIKQPV